MRMLLLGQGVFYFVTGIWPILHIPSFVLITGEKYDLWLVRTVGGLLAIAGLVFLFESRKSKPARTVIGLAIGFAAWLTLIDIYYWAHQVIAPIYLADAVAEIGLIAVWVYLLSRRGSLAMTS